MEFHIGSKGQKLTKQGKFSWMELIITAAKCNVKMDKMDQTPDDSTSVNGDATEQTH